MKLEDLKLPDITKLKQFHQPVNFIFKQDPTTDLITFTKELFTKVEFYCLIVKIVIFHTSLKPFVFEAVSTKSGQQLFFSFFHEPESLFLFGAEIKFVDDIPANHVYAIGRSYIGLKEVELSDKSLSDDYPEISLGILPKNIEKYNELKAFL